MKEVLLLIEAIELLISEYLKNSDDYNIAGGNLALCVIDEYGNVFGKVFGTDKARMRQSYHYAWTKASQVWMTGYKTGEFEVLIYNKKLNIEDYGLMHPQLIGWEGGQPILLKSGSKISVGFSGFRGTSDIEIVVRGLEMLE